MLRNIASSKEQTSAAAAAAAAHHLGSAAADSVYDKLRMFNGQAAAASWAWYGAAATANPAAAATAAAGSPHLAAAGGLPSPHNSAGSAGSAGSGGGGSAGGHPGQVLKSTIDNSYLFLPLESIFRPLSDRLNTLAPPRTVTPKTRRAQEVRPSISQLTKPTTVFSPFFFVLSHVRIINLPATDLRGRGRVRT